MYFKILIIYGALFLFGAEAVKSVHAKAATSGSLVARSCRQALSFISSPFKNNLSQNEWRHFKQKPSPQIIRQVQALNHQLRGEDLRPPFHHQKKYESWLFDSQQTELVPENPYGWRIVEKETPAKESPAASGEHRKNTESPDVFHHEIQIRSAPVWIDNSKLDRHDFQTWSQYVTWAEQYYQQYQSYPPGYLKRVKKRALDSLHGKSVHRIFTDERRLSDVVHSLGTENGQPFLLNWLNNLKGHEQWLDSGTGSGFVLEDIVLAFHKVGRRLRDIPYTLGVAYTPVGESQLPKNLSEKHHMIYDLFQNIPEEHLSQRRVKLITDFLGVYTYSSNPDRVINTYLNILEADGVIGIVYNVDVDIVITQGQRIPFHEWLQQVGGDRISVEYGRAPLGYSNIDNDHIQYVNYMLIRRLDDHLIELPHLVMSVEISTDKSVMIKKWINRRLFRPVEEVKYY